jgi:hypothetical protein
MIRQKDSKTHSVRLQFSHGTLHHDQRNHEPPQILHSFISGSIVMSLKWEGKCRLYAVIMLFHSLQKTPERKLHGFGS